MPSKLEDFMAKVIMPDAKLEELQSDVEGVIEEYKAQNTTIANLTSELEESRKNYSDLQARVLDRLFNNPKEPEAKKEEEEVKQHSKTFKEIISDNPWL